MTSHPYSDQWRAAVRDGAASSAEVIADLIVEDLGLPGGSRALDVGAGEGYLMRALQQRGMTALGLDGPWSKDPEIGRVDLASGPLPALDRFDLVSCLEVAEHVPAGRARLLVQWLCSMTDVVLFSAAVPGQGGEGHVNEQWPSYWCDLFDEAGFVGTGALRWRVWDDDRVEWWYRQNLLLFVDEGLRGTRPDGCPAVVHPLMFEHHLGRRRGRR